VNEPEREQLQHFLDAQRRAVTAIVDGLAPRLARRAILPSGWNVAGMVEHLAGSEYFWFEVVLAGRTEPPVWRGEASEGSLSLREAVGAYRRQWARSDAVFAETSLDALPRGSVPASSAEFRDARKIVLHMIEETARHAGHLDVARELLDGRTGLGPR
jgi:uncharacterized damage-inducible protein DinB